MMRPFNTTLSWACKTKIKSFWGRPRREILATSAVGLQTSMTMPTICCKVSAPLGKRQSPPIGPTLYLTTMTPPPKNTFLYSPKIQEVLGHRCINTEKQKA